MKNKYLWLSDTHLNLNFFWSLYELSNLLLEENPTAIFITGDIACGISLKSSLTYLAKKLQHINIYFVVGNHDYYTSSFIKTPEIIRELCHNHSNLIWLTEKEPIKLNDQTALIGQDGWYDARLGNPLYTNYNLDWIMIEEFRKLKTYDDKLALTRKIADEETVKIIDKLTNALKAYDTVYLCTHVPPWKEATRDLGTILEDFWLPYNVNSMLGKAIEKLMEQYPKQNIVVLSGHTHMPCDIRISHNIESRVQAAKYLGLSKNRHQIFI